MMKSIYFLLFIFIVPFSYSQKMEDYFPEDLLPLMDEFHDCILEHPDSCMELKTKLFEEAHYRNNFYLVAKMYSYQGIGYAYDNNVSMAIDCFKKSVEISEQLEPTDNLIRAKNNIANMYISLGDTLRAYQYFDSAYESALFLESKEQQAAVLIQMFSLMVNRPLDEKTLTQLYKIQALDNYIDEDMRAYFYLSYSQYFRNLEDYDSALNYAQTSNEIYTKRNDLVGIINSSYDIGMSLIGQKKYQEAIRYCEEGAAVAEENDFIIWKPMNCECLWKTYKGLGNSTMALKYLEKKTQFERDVLNADRIRELTQMEVQSEFDKIRFTDSLKTVQKEELLTKESELRLAKREQKIQILWLSLGALAIFLVLLIRQSKIRKNQNNIIASQRDKLAIKQNELYDSMHYAKRLQHAILPSPHRLKKLSENYFVIYRPKDVVSGDFYWYHERKFNGEKYHFFAVADCTGHGVPGAIVSVVCSNALDHAFAELTKPSTSDLLNKTNIFVKNSFKNKGDQLSDGMDVSIIAIPESKDKIIFSGANNHLLLVNKEGKSKEVKANRYSIGNRWQDEDFHEAVVAIETGDTVYLSSDGYPDQFGGDTSEQRIKRGKKYKRHHFNSLLEKIWSEPMSIQKEILINTHEKWKGEFEQTDDICVVGIRF